ncbi:hypothetical protein PROFUN_02360 [Planoprotostelium fungivorum]|uniref:Uncharacterized protein n=1 Tax=Planoprotostelium fungivorum TaxID=1890364 RepID=A0A2P6NUR3_9EUKA|nr:hypothetical protein PROFUN_02360 [Planoprotostelium fungivorum]
MKTDMTTMIHVCIDFCSKRYLAKSLYLCGSNLQDPMYCSSKSWAAAAFCLFQFQNDVSDEGESGQRDQDLVIFEDVGCQEDSDAAKTGSTNFRFHLRKQSAKRSRGFALTGG